MKPLLTELQSFRNCMIPRSIGIVKVIEQAAAFPHHHEQPTAGAVILFVLLKVLRQLIDPLREKRNLNIC